MNDLIPIAFKTVKIFSGITRRDLSLKPGERPHNVGNQIEVPFESPYFYEFVEHELAHILFKSNGLAKARFKNLFVTSCITAANQLAKEKRDPSIKIDANELSELLDTVINILDDHRVDGLWAQIYEGSGNSIRRMRKELAVKHKGIIDLPLYILYVALDIQAPNSAFAPFKPLIKEALHSVEGKGYGATLVAARKLLSAMIDSLIKQKRVPNTAGGRFKGMDDLGKAAAKGLPIEIERVLDDTWVIRNGGPPEEKEEADAIATQALGARGEAEVDKYLQDSAEEMSGLVKKALRGLVEPVDTKGTTNLGTCKIELEHGVPDDDLSKILTVEVEAATAARLKFIFQRVLGKKKVVRRDEGSILDIGMLIERRVTREPLPCFLEEESGAGFNALILMDRSSSMQGQKEEQAGRACRILRRALDFTFVDLDVWGFSQEEHDKVDIFVHHKKDLVFRQGRVPFSVTPLREAIHAAAQHLAGKVGHRHLFVVTDGAPEALTNPLLKEATSREALMQAVQTEVRRARKKGVHVTCLFIGDYFELPDRKVGPKFETRYSVRPAEMTQMFGSPQCWKRISSVALDKDLISLVSGAFERFISRS